MEQGRKLGYVIKGEGREEEEEEEEEEEAHKAQGVRGSSEVRVRHAQARQ
jgi:hypothetical protein